MDAASLDEVALALNGLTERVAQLEAELEAEQNGSRLLMQRAEAAEARVAALTQERDALRESGQRWAENVRAKENEIIQLRKSLSRIASGATSNPPHEISGLARRALAAGDNTTEQE